MNKNVKWLSGLSLAVFAASGLVYTGCTVTSGTVNDDGGIVRPDSGSDAATDGSTPTPDGGTEAGPACTQLQSTEVLNSAACTDCLKANCCTELVGCLDIADAGAVGCKDYSDCITTCNKNAAGDAGAANDCYANQCNLVASQEIQNAFDALDTCGSPKCGASCQ